MKYFLLIAMSFIIVGCGESYSRLEKDFPEKVTAKGNPIASNTIVLLSNKDVGAFSLNEIVSIYLNSNSIIMHVDFPFSLIHKPVSIPSNAIAGCEKTCFGKDNWQANILLAEQGISIGYKNAQEVIDWCWENHLPMITRKDSSPWLYSNGELPKRDGYEQVSRQKYAKQAEMRCRGY